MGDRRKKLSYTYILLILLFGVAVTSSLSFINGKKKIVETIHEFFPHENSLRVVLAEPGDVEFLPVFHVPVVVYTRDHVLQNCKKNTEDQDGYVLLASNTVHLEEQIFPLIKCFNQTIIKLKTKFTLLLDVSKSIIATYEENYSNVFHNVWKSFGIINIAILPVQDRILDTDRPLVFSYNPFLALQNSSPNALIRTSLQDVREAMIERFRNMHGHRLKSLFVPVPSGFVSLKDLNKKQPLGVDAGVLFKQILEEKCNVGFDVYQLPKKEKVLWEEMIKEIACGKAEYGITFTLLRPDGEPIKEIQMISNGININLVFVVPKPRRIDSWRYFMYIFQWKVYVGLFIVLLLLSGSALLLQYVQWTRINLNTRSNHASGASEVVSVWKAALSIAINRPPTTNSQRLLIAWSSLLGLIFLTLFSAKLYDLIKSKPRFTPIRTLEDLHDSNLPIFTIFPHLAPYLNFFQNTTLHKLKDNLRTDKLYEQAYFMDPKYLNITDRALVYTGTIVELLVSQRRNEKFLQYFQVVKEPLYRSMMMTYFPIGSVYYEHFNKWNLRVISGGIHLKWHNAHARRLLGHSLASSAPSVPKNSPQTEDGHAALMYDDLKMAFYALYFGLAISTLCFVIEVCHFKLIRWLSSRN